jgi:hypothetical protein
MELAVLRENLELSIEFELDEIAEGDGLDDIGSSCERISDLYRALAICKLLLEADTNAFYHDLMRSGHTRAYFMARCHREGHLQNVRLAASNVNAYFDSLASAGWDLAIRIASLSATSWFQDDEYEDDFSYARFFHVLTLAESQSGRKLEFLLDRYDLALEGNRNGRWHLCESFLSRNQEHFVSAFDEILRERAEQLAEDEESALGEEMTFVSEKHVFVEGLAILRMAERLGLSTDHEYQYIPGVARMPMTVPFPDNGYPKFEV